MLATDVPTSDTVMTLSRINYKVYADLGLTPGILPRQLTILDTGAGVVHCTIRRDSCPARPENRAHHSHVYHGYTWTPLSPCRTSRGHV